MGTRVNEYQTQLAVILFPDKQPVWLYMTFPATFVLACQFVGMVFFGQLPFLLQDIKHGSEGMNIKSTADAKFK